MPDKCDRCGITTNAQEGFAKERRLFRNTMRTLCPHCWQRWRAAVNGWMFLLQFAMGPIGLIILSRRPDDHTGWFLLNAFFFQVFLAISIAPHELAHALVAKCVGWRVFKIYMGSGKAVWKTKLFGIDTEFRPVPANGLVLAAPPTLHHYRRKMCAFALAGPTANLVVACVAFAFLGGTMSQFMAIGERCLPVQMLLLANLLLAIVSLAPWKFQTAWGKQPTDGLKLWQTIRTNLRVAVHHAAWFMLEGSDCREKGRDEEAVRWFEKGLQAYPEDTGLLNWHGISLLDVGKFTEARECFVKLLARTGTAPLIHSMIKNNIAYADALLGRSDLLEEADRYSLEAMASIAWHPAIKGTRGTVLATLGRYDEAVPLLRDAMKEHDSPRSKAANACWLAIAESKRGNPTAARAYFDEAKKLDSTCLWLERAQSALTQEWPLNLP
jgi:tetratricopeptide (TPR) repeat protein